MGRISPLLAVPPREAELDYGDDTVRVRRTLFSNVLRKASWKALDVLSFGTAPISLCPRS
jgi:hypothetical protein